MSLISAGSISLASTLTCLFVFLTSYSVLQALLVTASSIAERSISNTLVNFFQTTVHEDGDQAKQRR
jgi:hypothetical protein